MYEKCKCRIITFFSPFHISARALVLYVSLSLYPLCFVFCFLLPANAPSSEKLLLPIQLLQGPSFLPSSLLPCLVKIIGIAVQGKLCLWLYSRALLPNPLAYKEMTHREPRMNRPSRNFKGPWRPSETETERGSEWMNQKERNGWTKVDRKEEEEEQSIKP